MCLAQLFETNFLHILVRGSPRLLWIRIH